MSWFGRTKTQRIPPTNLWTKIKEQNPSNSSASSRNQIRNSYYNLSVLNFVSDLWSWVCAVAFGGCLFQDFWFLFLRQFNIIHHPRAIQAYVISQLGYWVRMSPNATNIIVVINFQTILPSYPVLKYDGHEERREKIRPHCKKKHVDNLVKEVWEMNTSPYGNFWLKSEWTLDGLGRMSQNIRTLYGPEWKSSIFQPVPYK